MDQTIEQEYIGTRELATMTGRSVKWVEKWRTCIVGAVKIGGTWSFHLPEIRSYLALKKDIVVKNRNR